MSPRLTLFALLLAAPTGGCIRGANSEYCDVATPCRDGRACDVVRHECFTGDRDLGVEQTEDLAPPPDLAKPCLTSSDCTEPGRAICRGGQCVPCGASDGGLLGDGGALSLECSTERPGTRFCLAGDCVQCLAPADCNDPLKACSATTHKCGPCAAHDECVSRYCQPGGTCADPAKITYVRTSVNCPRGSGKMNDPFCKLSDALPKAIDANPSEVIVVLGGTYAEDIAIAGSDKNDVVVVLVGSGGPSLQPLAPASPALAIEGDRTGKHALAVTVVGFTIGKAPFQPGIKCHGTVAIPRTSLKLDRVTVSENTGLTAGFGIVSDTCDLTIERSTIGPNNKAGGIDLAATDFTIVNTVILRNGTAGKGTGSEFGGLKIGSFPTRGQIVNASVVGNVADAQGAQQSGIICSNTPILFNTVIADNSGPASQINADKCLPDHSAFPGASLPGNLGTNNLDLGACAVAALFLDANANDYRPAKGGMKPCTLVDQGTNAYMGVKAPAIDFDGKGRPAGPAFDIGAFEAR